MTKKTKYVMVVVVCLFVLLCGVYIYWYGAVVMPVTCAMASIEDVGELIASYIREYNGRFPASEDDLIQCYYLMKKESADRCEYLYRPYQVDPNFGDKEHWTALRSFGLMQLWYGVEVDDIEMTDGKLYDKTTHKHILLIDGPHKKWLQKKCYEPISLELYELMLKEKQKYKDVQQ